ncbi:hypothetical protein FVE85_0651 [Porphyridium purpureum]|uniref:Uncharacterized protein n=1 Tax=Porphyridium purpureum TaxID=35688 RepID=A0A5J4Z1A1_PORPP|nr:hypothetical protein FVE85_0651 [Porphyridium purpureum]|eukprot:POR6389..scf208_2
MVMELLERALKKEDWMDSCVQIPKFYKRAKSSGAELPWIYVNPWPFVVLSEFDAVYLCCDDSAWLREETFAEAAAHSP